jgi:type II secretory pathway component PulK
MMLLARRTALPRSSERGVALVTVLWFLSALSLLSAATLVTARNGIETTRNRLLLLRAGWAREACAEILLGRHAERVHDPARPSRNNRQPSIEPIDSVDLGRGVWCRVDLEDPSARLDLNLANPEALRSILGNDSLTDALLDWRDEDDVARPHGTESTWYDAMGRSTPRNAPLAHVRELALVRGFDTTLVRRLEPVLTTRGTGQININAAPLEVVATLPGMTDDARMVLAHRRDVGRALEDVHGLVAELAPAARQVFFAAYREFAQQAIYTPPHWIAVVEGHVAGSPVRSRMALTVVPVGDRIAVLRREVEP